MSKPPDAQPPVPWNLSTVKFWSMKHPLIFYDAPTLITLVVVTAFWVWAFRIFAATRSGNNEHNVSCYRGQYSRFDVACYSGDSLGARKCS